MDVRDGVIFWLHACPQIIRRCTDGIAAVFRSSWVRETTKRRESEGERWDEGATAETGGRRGTSSRGEGGCTHDARTASPGFLLSSPRLSRAPLASGRQVEGGNLRGLSALPSLPLFNTSKELRNSNKLVSGARYQLGLRGGPTLPYIGPTSGLREGGPT